MTYRVLLFDLFRTLLCLDPRAPTTKVMASGWRAAMEPLRARAGRLLPQLPFDGFLDALIAVTVEIAGARTPEAEEVPARIRYRMALARMGCDTPDADAIAGQLAYWQMVQLAAHASVPAEYVELLHELAPGRRLGLVSNFDYAPVVRDILDRDGLRPLLAVTLVSVEFGRRKPHPAIFAEALRRIDADPRETLFVGDSLPEDVGGAQAAGMDTAWLNPAGLPSPADGPQPTYSLARLTDLRAILGADGASTDRVNG